MNNFFFKKKNHRKNFLKKDKETLPLFILYEYHVRGMRHDWRLVSGGSYQVVKKVGPRSFGVGWIIRE